MSPELALRQAGSRESSAGGFRRAELAQREAGWTASRWARITQAGPGPRRIRPRAAGYASVRSRPHLPGAVAGPGSSLLVRCYFDQVVLSGGAGPRGTSRPGMGWPLQAQGVMDTARLMMPAFTSPFRGV